MTSLYSSVGFQPQHRYVVACPNSLKELECLAEELKQTGLVVLPVRASMPPGERSAALEQFVQGSILIASKSFLAAGGFYFPNLPDVQDIIVMEASQPNKQHRDLLAQIAWRFRPKPATLVCVSRFTSMEMARASFRDLEDSRPIEKANPCGEISLSDTPENCK